MFSGVSDYFREVSAYFRLEASFQNFEASFEKFGATMATGGVLIQESLRYMTVQNYRHPIANRRQSWEFSRQFFTDFGPTIQI